MKHSRFLGQFVIYEENKVLLIQPLIFEYYTSSNKLNHRNYLESMKGLAFWTLDICITYKYKLAPSGALM